MSSSSVVSEIVEAKDDQESVHRVKGSIKSKIENSKSRDDLNHLFNQIDLGASSRHLWRKNASKKPVKVGASQASQIEISESITLKQALRRICISQASELAAMKRILKPNESETVKRLLASVVIPNSKPEEKGNLIKISLVPEKSMETRIQDVIKSTETDEVLSESAKTKIKGKANSKNSVTKNKTCTKTKVKQEPELAIVSSTECTEMYRPKIFFREKETGESSQSSKSSIGEHSCTTSISDESQQSFSNGRRPHMSNDVRWEAIRDVTQNGNLGLQNFRLLKRLGCGDIGTVYLAELISSDCLFALKVMDVDYLLSRKKMMRAQTEREILQMLDHPFLPTLYANFSTENLSCLVMEFCPGGDLHVLRQKQPSRCFSEAAARFYVAEVLLALEYLHMLGVVYRDLKPENVLVHEDGHIMLSDFDLSLRCSVNPTLLKSSSVNSQNPTKKPSGPCTENTCIEPFCLQPSCYTPTTWKPKPDATHQLSVLLPQLVAEPTDARSNSFVGTQEYLAPEIIRGDGHGSSVDWWTFGIFLYELLYGKTPFRGPSNDETLANVISQGLRFPDSPMVSFQVRDLIRALLVKEPDDRLGSVKGAAEIKKHPFFEGLNWALVRCAIPPEIPRSCDVCLRNNKKEGSKCLDFGSTVNGVKFELF